MAEGVREAFDALEWEIAECTLNLSVPQVTASRFEYDEQPECDATVIERELSESSFSVIDVLAENGESWYEFSVSGKAFEPETGESASISLSTSGVSVMSKDDSLTFETFQALVETLEDAVGCDLVYVEGDDG